MAFIDMCMVFPDRLVSGLDERIQAKSLAQGLARVLASFPFFPICLEIILKVIPLFMSFNSKDFHLHSLGTIC